METNQLRMKMWEHYNKAYEQLEAGLRTANELLLRTTTARKYGTLEKAFAFQVKAAGEHLTKILSLRESVRNVKTGKPLENYETAVLDFAKTVLDFSKEVRSLRESLMRAEEVIQVQRKQVREIRGELATTQICQTKIEEELEKLKKNRNHWWSAAGRETGRRIDAETALATSERTREELQLQLLTQASTIRKDQEEIRTLRGS